MRNPCHNLANRALLLLCTCFFAAPASATALPKLSVADVTISEVSCNSQVATFTVSISAPFGKNGTVQFSTADGTAIAGTDYTAVSGTLSFPRGSKASQTITVPITDVLIPGPNKTFYVNLSNAVNATLSKSQGTGTIQAPAVAKCQSCGLSCNKGDACFTDSCDAVRGCQHVNTSATATPYCSLLEQGGSCVGTAWVDSDGDGFSDAAEAQGYIDVNANGVYDPGIDIPLPGADPNKPDVYLHYDYTLASDHSHNPPAQAIQWIVDAFAAHGVNLHIDSQHNAICENAGDAGCITAGTGAHVVTLSAAPDPSCVGSSAVSHAQMRAAVPYLNLIKPAYHYMIFGHYVGCPGDNPGLCANCPTDPTNPACGSINAQKPSGENLGYAEVIGDDSVVATQPYVDAGIPIVSIPLEAWSGISMHEFGHNLGLLHGGSFDAGASACNNNKPNYVSVMSYSFYKSGILVGGTPGDIAPKSCSTDDDCSVGDHAVSAHCSTTTNTCFRIDYSDRLFNTLDETGAAGGLDETIGLQGGVNNTDISFWHAGTPTPYVKIPTNGSPIDWNKDGNFTDTGIGPIEVNDGDGFEVDSGQNDWATTSINGVNHFTNWNFSYQCNPNFGDDLIIPRDLRFGKEEPTYASAKPNFEQLFQRYWQKAGRMQPAGSWASNTVVHDAGAPTQVPARSQPAVDWLKERVLRLDP
jgi:hypothetical protein